MSLGQEVKCTLSYPYQLLQAGSCTTLILADFYQTVCNSPSDKPPHLTACQLPKARAKPKTWGSCESRFSAAGVGRGETSMGTSALALGRRCSSPGSDVQPCTACASPHAAARDKHPQLLPKSAGMAAQVLCSSRLG